MDSVTVSHEELFVPVKTCKEHGRAIVTYKGPACPFCLALDDLDDTRRKLDALEAGNAYLRA